MLRAKAVVDVTREAPVRDVVILKHVRRHAVNEGPNTQTGYMYVTVEIYALIRAVRA